MSQSLHLSDKDGVSEPANVRASEYAVHYALLNIHGLKTAFYHVQENHFQNLDFREDGCHIINNLFSKCCLIWLGIFILQFLFFSPKADL